MISKVICKINLFVLGDNMWKWVLIVCMCMTTFSAHAQMAALNKAKYIATLKVVVNHKMNDADIQTDLEKLRESNRFKKDLEKIVGRLDNSRPNEATNRRIMRILEDAGKQIYNELK